MLIPTNRKENSKSTEASIQMFLGGVGGLWSTVTWTQSCKLLLVMFVSCLDVTSCFSLGVFCCLFFFCSGAFVILLGFSQRVHDGAWQFSSFWGGFWCWELLVMLYC